MPRRSRLCVRWASGPPPQKGGTAPNFRPMCILAIRLDESRRHLAVGTEMSLGPGHIVPDGDPALRKKGGGAPSPIVGPCDVYCGQTAEWIKIMALGVEVGLDPGARPHCAKWRPSFPAQKGHSPLQFSSNVCCAQTAGESICHFVWR